MKTFRIRCHFVLLASLALWLIRSHTFAASHTWTGNGPNALWSTPSNWENSSPPFANETPVGLVFPTTANRRTSTNNIGGLQISSLALQGAAYTLRGLGAGTNMTLLPGGTFGTLVVFTGTGHTLDSSLNLTLTGTNIVAVADGASLAVVGRVTGSGALAKSNGGTLRLRGASANTFTGATLVQAGTLELFSGSTAIPGPLIVGTTNGATEAMVSWLAGNQVADTAPVTVHEKSKLLLNAFNETIGSLTVVEGMVDTGTGVLTTGSITFFPTDTPGSAAGLHGTLELLAPGTNTITTFGTPGDAFFLEANIRGGSGGSLAALDKRGPGILLLQGSNSFTGITLVSEGLLVAAHSRALGTANQGVLVSSNAVLRLRDAQVKDETLTLSQGASFDSERESSWSGPVTLAGDAFIHVNDNSPNGKTLTLYGKLSGPGGFTKRGVGILALNGTVANSYGGITFVQQGELQLGNGPGFNVPAIPGLLHVGDIGSAAIPRVTWLAPGQLATNAMLQADGKGVADLQQFAQTIGSLRMNGGSITSSPAGLLTLQGPLTNFNSSVIAAPLSLGPAATNLYSQNNQLRITRQVSVTSSRIFKSGSGSLRLDGDSDYAGTISAQGGGLGIYGAWPQAAIELNPSTTLFGTGAAGVVTMNGGEIYLDTSTTPLHVQHLIGISNALFRTHILDADHYGGIVTAQAPQLNEVISIVDTMDPNYDPPVGQVFNLIHNDSAHPVGGVFRGASPGAEAEGTVFRLNSSRYFRLSYLGGDGNDVTITRIPTPVAPGPALVSRESSGIRVSTTGTYGAFYFVEATQSLTPPVQWLQLGNGVVAQSDGSVSLVDTNAVNYPQRFYRFYR